MLMFANNNRLKIVNISPAFILPFQFPVFFLIEFMKYIPNHESDLAGDTRIRYNPPGFINLESGEGLAKKISPPNKKMVGKTKVVFQNMGCGFSSLLQNKIIV